MGVCSRSQSVRGGRGDDHGNSARWAPYLSAYALPPSHLEPEQEACRLRATKFAPNQKEFGGIRSKKWTDPTARETKGCRDTPTHWGQKRRRILFHPGGRPAVRNLCSSKPSRLIRFIGPCALLSVAAAWSVVGSGQQPVPFENGIPVAPHGLAARRLPDKPVQYDT